MWKKRFYVVVIYNKHKVLKNVVHVVLWYRCGIFALSALRYFTVLPLFMRLSGHLLFPAMACVNSFFVPLRPVKRGTKQVKNGTAPLFRREIYRCTVTTENAL